MAGARGIQNHFGRRRRTPIRTWWRPGLALQALSRNVAPRTASANRIDCESNRCTVRPNDRYKDRCQNRTTLSSRDCAPQPDRSVLSESPVAAASLPVVQVLAGLPGRITRILIEPATGHYTQVLAALTHRLGSTQNIRPAGGEGRLLAPAAHPESRLTVLFSAISLVVGTILAYNALLLASGERRHFILYLIDLGSEPSTIIAFFF